MKIALYPGSFDPITNGHTDVLREASVLFDKIYVSIAHNASKKTLFSVDERVALIKEWVQAEGMDNIEVVHFEGLTVEYAKKVGAKTIIRGLRAISDFDFEFQMALTNKQLDTAIQTVFLMSSQEHFYMSSTIVKEVARLNGEVSSFVSAPVKKALIQKLTK